MLQFFYTFRQRDLKKVFPKVSICTVATDIVIIAIIIIVVIIITIEAMFSKWNLNEFRDITYHDYLEK